MITDTEPRHPPRISGIDFIRGLAIFFVLMNHVNMRLWLAKIPYTKGLPLQLVSSLVWNGQFGVQMFFVVSGFLITSTALKRWNSLSKIRVRDFYVLRFARIAPLMGGLLIVLSFLHLLGLSTFVVSAKTGGLESALFHALTFRINVLEAHRGYLPPSWDVLWSLSVEEAFYLFFPLICFFLGQNKKLFILLLIFVIAGPFARTEFAYNEVWREYSYLGCMDAIALGCLTAVLISRVQFSRNALLALTTIGTTLIVFIMGFSILARAWGLRQSGLDMTLLAIGTAMAIVAAVQTRWKAPAILKPLLLMGERSYEIYLTHMFVVLILFEIFLKLGKPMGLVPGFFILAVVVSSLLGDLVSRFYSEPLNGFIRKKWRQRISVSLEQAVLPSPTE